MNAEPEVIDAEVVEDDEPERAELAVRPDVTLAAFNAPDPGQQVERMTEYANALRNIIEKQGLYKVINDRKHVLVEGWTTLGALVGVFPVPIKIKPIDGGYEAHVEARTPDGRVVGAGFASCTFHEENWTNEGKKKKTDNQRMSMAQTRATSKALKTPLSFVMTLAGYSPTPAEEMDNAGNWADSPAYPLSDYTCPGQCGSRLFDMREEAKGSRRPRWKCSAGKKCKNQNDKGYEWGSWNEDPREDGAGLYLEGQAESTPEQPPESGTTEPTAPDSASPDGEGAAPPSEGEGTSQSAPTSDEEPLPSESSIVDKILKWPWDEIKPVAREVCKQRADEGHSEKVPARPTGLVKLSDDAKEEILVRLEGASK